MTHKMLITRYEEHNAKLSRELCESTLQYIKVIGNVSCDHQGIGEVVSRRPTGDERSVLSVIYMQVTGRKHSRHDDLSNACRHDLWEALIINHTR